MNLLHFLSMKNLPENPPAASQVPHAGGATTANPAGITPEEAKARHMMRLHMSANSGRKRLRVTSGMLAVFSVPVKGGAK